MIHAAAALYPSALATSVTLPMEILRAANQMASAGQRGRSQLQFRLLGDQPRITLDSGLTLETTGPLSDLPSLDLLLLPAIWRKPEPTVRNAASWLNQLPALAERGTRICSVGTAARLLAEAGMLEGRPATTHWHDFERFAHRYPGVHLKTRHLITQSGPIYCVGSVNSIADLMVHLVDGWFGARIARAVENQFSPEIRRPFHGAAYQDRAGGSHHDELVLVAQQQLRDRLATPPSVEELARESGVSTRTLNRRFRRATGASPLGYLQSQRIISARELLRRSNLAVSEIAWQVGLQDVSYFSKLFRNHCGMSPGEYREAARGKLFAPQQDA